MALNLGTKRRPELSRRPDTMPLNAAGLHDWLTNLEDWVDGQVVATRALVEDLTAVTPHARKPARLPRRRAS